MSPLARPEPCSFSVGSSRRGLAAVGATIAFAGVTMFASVGVGTGCLTSSINVIIGAEGGVAEGGVVSVEGDDPSKNDKNKDGITYRSIDGHPGCTTAGLEARAAGCPKTGGAYSGASIAQIPGYKCAAKVYSVTEDKTKPIVILVHGNSDTPSGWETFADAPTPPGPQPMLAEKLTAAGFKVISPDFRFDKVDDPATNNDTENAGQNFDHGWAVPILEHLIESVIAAEPDRQISIVGFSVGSTVIRDALRRLHRDNKKPFEHFKDVVLASGANHGVSTYRKLCGSNPDTPSNPTMRGKVACQLGDLTAFQPTKFLAPLNGPNGDFETPCADGDVAFGQKGVCGGHKVRYTTVVMQDAGDGKLQDEFVSQNSAALNGASNQTVTLADKDVSKYFCNGLFDDHYGAVRSDAGLAIVLGALSAP